MATTCGCDTFGDACCFGGRCLIPECEDPLQTEFRPPWLTSAVPFSDSKPVGCHRYAAAPGATLPDNGSCIAGMFTGEEVACSQWVYPKSSLSIMSEVVKSRRRPLRHLTGCWDATWRTVRCLPV